MGDWGLPFEPLKPTQEEQTAAQFSLLASELGRLRDCIESTGVMRGPDGGMALVSAAAPDVRALSAEIGAAIREAMRFVAPVGREEIDSALIEAIREQTQKIMALNKKVGAMSIMPSGGSSGHVIVDGGTLALSQPVDVSDRDARLLGHVVVDSMPAGGAVALDAATLAALESVTTTAEAPSGASHSVFAPAVASAVLAAANPARLGLTVFNPNATAKLYLRIGAAASTTAYSVRIDPGAYYELAQPACTAAIHGVWDVAAGASAQVTELA